MKNLLAFLSLSFLLCNQAQMQTCDYKTYNTEILQALTEKHSNNNWTESHELFKSAFNKVKTPYGKDLEEALEVSLKLKDDTQSEFITKKLLVGGIPVQYFDKYPLVINSEWWSEFDSYEIEKKYQEEYDCELLNRLLSLRTQDSLFNVDYHQFRTGKKQFELEYLVEKGRGVLDGFKALVKDHGFPAEVNTGYLYRNNKIEDLPTNVILIHITQLGENMIYFDFAREDLICNGYLKEFQYEHLSKLYSIGDGNGVEYEMALFYEKYKNKS